MWLFRFPLFFTTRNLGARNTAIVSFVVRLSRAACDRDHAGAARLSHRVREVLQRLGRIGGLDDRDVLAGLKNNTRPTLDQHAARSLRDRLADEVVGVVARPAQRDKEIVWLQRARVGDDVPDFPRRIP